MIFRLVLFAVVTCLLCIVLKDNFRSGAIMVAICGCISLFAVFAKIFAGMDSSLKSLGDIDGVDRDGVGVILKTLLVAYLTGFGSDICTDAGERAVASALETAGKAIMLSMALPMLMGIFRSVKDILGG